MRVTIVGCKNERVNTFTVYIYQKVKILSQSQAPTPLFLGLEEERRNLKPISCFQLDLLVIILDPDEHDSGSLTRSPPERIPFFHLPWHGVVSDGVSGSRRDEILSTDRDVSRHTLSLFVSISFPTRERKIENFDSLFSFFTPSKINSGEKDGREQCFLGGQPRVFPLPSIFPGFPLGGGSKKREGRDLSLVIARNRRRKFRSLGKKCHRASLHPLGISWNIDSKSIDRLYIDWNFSFFSRKLKKKFAL